MISASKHLGRSKRQRTVNASSTKPWGQAVLLPDKKRMCHSTSSQISSRRTCVTVCNRAPLHLRPSQPAQPAQLSLPIQNRRTRAVTLSVEPREGAAEVGGVGGGVCLPIKNRRTRGVILEAAEFNPENRLAPPGLNLGRGQEVSGTGDMTRRAVHNPLGHAFAPDSPTALVPRLPSSPAATSSARTSSVPASPSVMSRNSRVHFAASPASVVEITPYSWTSRSSAYSPTSPTFATEASPTSLNAPQGQGSGCSL